MVANPNRKVTAGWIADRGLGFSEYAVEVCLRNLRKDGKISRTYEHLGGFPYWVYPPVPEPADPLEVAPEPTVKRKPTYPKPRP
jgi:hypothetical protein